MTEIDTDNLGFGIEAIETLKELSKAVNTDWFAANIKPINAPSLHRITIMVNTATVVKLLMDDGTNTNLVMNLNDGVALDANDLYTFDIPIPEGYSYNIQHVTTTQNINCWIVELSAGAK